MSEGVGKFNIRVAKLAQLILLQELQSVLPDIALAVLEVDEFVLLSDCQISKFGFEAIDLLGLVLLEEGESFF